MIIYKSKIGFISERSIVCFLESTLFFNLLLRNNLRLLLFLFNLNLLLSGLSFYGFDSEYFSKTNSTNDK